MEVYLKEPADVLLELCDCDGLLPLRSLLAKDFFQFIRSVLVDVPHLDVVPNVKSVRSRFKNLIQLWLFGGLHQNSLTFACTVRPFVFSIGVGKDLKSWLLLWLPLVSGNRYKKSVSCFPSYDSALIRAFQALSKRQLFKNR